MERTAAFLIDHGIERGPDVTAVGKNIQHRLLLKQDAEDKQPYRSRAFSEAILPGCRGPNEALSVRKRTRDNGRGSFRGQGSRTAPSSWEFP